MQGTIQEALFMFWASQIKENIINELIIFLCFLLQPITGILKFNPILPHKDTVINLFVYMIL